MTEPTPFAHTLTSADDLAGLYREPSALVQAKETAVLDDGCRQVIALSTFVLVGTSDGDGNLDVSPRGGPAGFVEVLDERRLVIPDLNGNNRLDSIRNIIEQGRIGLLFLIPGFGEMLRINGAACITTDDAVLDRFTDELRRPTSAIGVTVDTAFIHCAKSIRRAGLWEPDTWSTTDEQPSAGQIVVDHVGLDMDGAELDRRLEEGYAADLAADRPEA